MSNVIPIVSSSPPPLDDHPSYGWGDDDDDDDDFGNFTSAPYAGVSSSGDSVATSEFDADWSQVNLHSASESDQSRECTPAEDKIHAMEEEGKAAGRIETADEMVACDPIENGINGNETEGDDFADFSGFQSVNNSKPCCGSLPLEISEGCEQENSDGVGQTEPKASEECDEKNLATSQTGEPVMQESTTDSGMFSTDMSPVPKSDSILSDCDKNMPSEDETILDLPQDGQQASNSFHPEDDFKLVATADDAFSVGTSGLGDSSRSATPETMLNSTSLEEGVPAKLSRQSSQELEEIQASVCHPPDLLPEQENAKVQCIQEHKQRSVSAECCDALSSDLPSQADVSDAETSKITITSNRLESGSNSPIYEHSKGTEDKVAEISEYKDLTEHEDKTVPDSCCMTETFDDKSVDVCSGGDDEEDNDQFDSDSNDEWPGFQHSSHQNSEPEDLVLKTENLKEEDGDDLDFDDDGTFGQFSSLSDADLPELKKIDASRQMKCNSPQISDHVQVEPEAGRETEDGEDANNDDFGDFRGPCSHKTSATEEPLDFSSTQTDEETIKPDDEFTELRSFENQAADDDFGDFSSETKNNLNEDSFSFGNSSEHQAVSDDAGWADFSKPAEEKFASNDDFGNFAMEDPSSALQTGSESSSTTAHSKIQGSRLSHALASCFPHNGPETSTIKSLSEAGSPENAQDTTQGKDGIGLLETIIHFGLNYKAASLQTWEVVEHPSKKDPWVRLWNHLKDIDGTPAVVYQWLKSSCNSHLFKTLCIDTQNMLIGHKKPSVPIFATGLSLLEPIRGSGGERRNKNQHASTMGSTLVDPSQQEPEKFQQESETFEKPSDEWDWVFESELLDAPRASVKSLQPLEDILKNVKPTSVRSRRDGSSASKMSPEAARIIANLPDLTFMQSKVLMFPIKN
ncbi:aftiphilin-like isoform X3 [Pomacea canaliculata]|uniref:aftiphilin-like isoform X3 n=1 Tax=Pomacea canaliculata TaxID=400727 RepID=UPI000D7265AB|nr:aftiphilin-like isoform X3 [Pomacea canaliculata]